MDKYKVIDNVMVFLLVFFPLMALLAYPIAYWPHYEKAVYEKQEPLTWESMEEIHQNYVKKYGEMWTTNFTGYPTKGMHTELVSYEQFEENAYEEPYCLEVDVENLKPTGLYKRVYEFESVASGGAGVGVRRSAQTSIKSAEQYTSSRIKTVLNRSKAIYAQYYILTLDDGNKILVLLNDTMVEIPKNGKIQLPYAEKVGLHLDEIGEKKNDLLEKYNLHYIESGNRMEILNASTGWLLINNDIEEAHEDRIMLWLLLFCIGIGGTFLTFFSSVLLIKKVK